MNARYSNCMAMSPQTKCGCVDVTQKLFNRKIVQRLFFEIKDKVVSDIAQIPKCEGGPCLIYCENRYGTRNYWPQECIGTTYCTCGRSGAVCR